MEIDWEQRYREDDAPWDKGAPSPGLLDYLDDHRLEGTIVVPGCGFGYDVRALAASPGAPEVLGLDVAPTPIAAASGRPRAGRERYVVGDWFDPAAEWNTGFDWIWEHTCFCAIDPDMRAAYVDSAFAVLKPGGALFAVFYLDPYDDEHRPGGGPPHGVEERDLIERFTAGGRFSVEQRWVPQSTYSGRENRELMMLLRRAG